MNIEVEPPLCVQSEQDVLTNPERLTRCGIIEWYLKEFGEYCWNKEDFLERVKSDRQFYFMVNKYLDIDCEDEILYLDSAYDDVYADWPQVIQNKFCLCHPVDVYHLKANKVKKAYEFVRVGDGSVLRRGKLYDKVIIKNCLKFFENQERAFCDFLLSLLKDQIQQKTSLLIIQRVSDLNTLPYPSSIATQWASNDIPYTRFMETLQKLYFTLVYDIEMFKALLPCKSAWFRQLTESTTYPLNPKGLIIEKDSVKTRLHDVRELNEGVFKYQPFAEAVELTDRMLFISAYRPVDRQNILIERMRTSGKTRVKGDREVDDEIKTIKMEITDWF